MSECEEDQLRQGARFFFKRLEAEFQASFTVVKVDRNSNGVLEGWYKSKRAVIQALLPSEGFRKPRRHR